MMASAFLEHSIRAPYFTPFQYGKLNRYIPVTGTEIDNTCPSPKHNYLLKRPATIFLTAS